MKELVGPERSLSSDRLRLRGQVDRIRRLDLQAYEIRDYKSGNALGGDGEVKPQIQLQLRAYGLMLLEYEPHAEIRLVVDDGLERDVPFDSGARAAAADQIERTVENMPPSGPASTAVLAKPGSGCFGCSLRHVCGAYRTEAPTWWKHFPAALERIPNDTWGQLVELRPSRFLPAVDATLLDASGRRVRVDGLAQRHRLDDTVLPGSVAFFQLEATGPTRGFDGRRYHPRAFHELARDGRERRAWSAVCFVGQEDDD